VTDSNSELRKGLAAIWQKSLPRVNEQIAALEAIAESLAGGPLDAEEMRTGEREAHKLAGSLGTFGFHEGTRIAREIETLMGSGRSPDPAFMSSLVSALRKSIAES
jgi:HPt (histidine-containing phosphotransfer) domain-containing protein